MAAIAFLGIGLAGLAGVMLAPIFAVHPAMGARDHHVGLRRGRDRRARLVLGRGDRRGRRRRGQGRGHRGGAIRSTPKPRSTSSCCSCCWCARAACWASASCASSSRCRSRRDLLYAAAALVAAALRAARDRPRRHLGHRGRDLRDGVHGAQHPRGLHRASCRSGTARGSGSRPTPRRSCSASYFKGAFVLPVGDRRGRRARARVGVRLPDPAAARRLLLAADARALGDALRGRLPLDRRHRRRERAGRHHAAGAGAASRSRTPTGYYALVAAIGFVGAGAPLALPPLAAGHACSSRSARTSSARASWAIPPTATSSWPSWPRRGSPGSRACCSSSTTA